MNAKDEINNRIRLISEFIIKYYNTIPNKSYNIYIIYNLADKCVTTDYSKKRGCNLLDLDNAVKHLIIKPNMVYNKNETDNNYV